MHQPKIKICGLTNLPDALMAAEYGADALGFIFAPSKRLIEPATARDIIRQLPPLVTTVGVFMDVPLSDVIEISQFTGIDVVQLHGNEPPEYCDQIKTRVIKRFGVGPRDNAAGLMRKISTYNVSGYMLDPGAGDGQSFDWDIAKSITVPLIIAGGLHPDNVAELVAQLQPYGVDVSTGVETSPGKKDAAKVRGFIRSAKL